MPSGVLTLEQLEEVVAAYAEFDEFVFDVETFGEHRLDPRRNEIFWISLAGPGRADVIPCGHPIGERIAYAPGDALHRISPQGKHQERRINPDSGREKWFDVPEPFTPAPKQLWVSQVTELLQPIMFSEQRKIGHGVKFDLESIAKYYGGKPPAPPYGDTLAVARLVNENYLGYKLGQCVQRAFGYEYDKSKGKKLEVYPYTEAYEYSYLDAKYCWLLWQKLVPLLDKEEVRHIFDLEMDLLPVLVDMEMTGVSIDVDGLEKLQHEFGQEMARLKVQINKAAGHDINLNANRQVAELVYDKLGHECLFFTEKTHERQVTKEALEACGKDKIVKAILEYQKYAKLQSTFVGGLLASHVNGRIHPDFNQMGAVSGRLSCRNPNLQNQPSRSEIGKKIRQVFIASPGYSLIVIDLSQIELRVLAHFTKDPNLLRAYRKGEDLHGMTAAIVFGPDYTDIQRSYAKNSNFSIVYGAGPMTLVRKYGVPTLKMAKALLATFYAQNREVKPWKFRVVRNARNRYDKKKKIPPYVMTILGRKRRLPEMMWADDTRRSAAERQAVSVRVSGTAADIFKLMMVECHRVLREQYPDARILITVHDELVIEAPENQAEDVLALVKKTMETTTHPDTGEPILSVPIVAEGKIVEHWGQK